MAAFVKRSLSYAAFMYPNGTNEGRINIYCEDNYKLYILFKAPGETLPGNTFSGTIGVAYESVDRYPFYIDLLRNESPIWVTFNPDAKSYVVYCSGEPVGEGEV